MNFSITKLLSGFAFWKGEVIGKIIYIAIIVTICLGVYHKITQTTISTSNKNVLTKPGTVNIDQRQSYPEKEDALFLGFKLWSVKLGIMMEGDRNVKSTVDSDGDLFNSNVSARRDGVRQSEETGPSRVDGQYKDEGRRMRNNTGYLSRLWGKLTHFIK